MQKKLQNARLWVIIFTVFVDLLGVGILIPVVPQLLANPRSEYFLLPKNMSLNQGFILLGFLTAAFPLAQFLATPILGQLSDKFGRKKILALSLAGTCLSYVVFALGIYFRNLPLLFVSRAFDGVTGGNISVAQAAIADVTEPKDRAKNFGLIGAAFGLGFILGPYIGGKLSDPAVFSWFNATTPFWFVALLSFINVLSVIFLFPETLEIKKEAMKIDWGKSFMNIFHAYMMEKLRVIFMSNFLFQAGFTFFTTFFSVFLINKFNFTQGNIGDFFSYVGLWVAITQAVITRRLAGKVREDEILRISIMISALGIVLYFLPHAWWQLLFITPIFAVANGLTQANIAALISKTAARSIQGEVLGINASVQALAQAIPPMLSGYIAASLSPEAPLIVSAIVIATAGFVFSIFYDSTSSNRLAVEEAEYTQSVEDSKQSEQSIHNEDEIIHGTIDL